MLNKGCVMNGIRALFLVSILPVSLHAARVVPSNSPGATSFAFTIFPHAYHVQTGAFFVGANVPVADNAFAVAGTTATRSQFIPIAPATVTLDGIADQPNPLFGAQINHLALLGPNPLVVHAGEPNKVYFIDNFSREPISQIASPQLLDSVGIIAGDIKNIVSNSPDGFAANESMFFAYVTPMGGSTGDVGSGISSVLLQAGTPLTFSVSSADALDRTSSALAINTSVTITDDAVAMHYSPALDRVYLGFNVLGGPGVTDGVRGVTAGVSPIVATSALTSDSIIGAVGANSAVSIHHISTMATTSRLVYLIGVGGIGSPSATAQSVFALPIVNDSDSPVFGTLASKNAQPVNVFETGSPFRFISRALKDPAVNPGDLFTTGDLPTKVGGDSILPGPVRDIIAVGDGVVVAVDEAPGTTQAGGLFLSRAILNQSGLIVAWTSWQRMSSIAEPVFGLAYDGPTTSFWAMPGADAASINTVLLTEWSSAPTFAGIINNYFTPETAGIQGIVSFPLTTPGFNQNLGSRQAATLFAGTSRFVLAATARDEGPFLKPVAEPSTIFEAINGRLLGFAGGADAIVVTGGDLSRVGPIVTAAYCFDGVQGWFIVGGTHGCSILARGDGSGISTLSAGFAGLDSEFKMIPLAVPGVVRKIIADGSLLYILTNDALYRTTLTPSAIASGAPALIELARAGTLPHGAHTHLSDCVISGDRALLATSSGLLATVDSGSIATAPGRENLWRLFFLPESPGGVVHLNPISPTGATGWATASGGGMIDCLAATVSENQSRVYRLVTTTAATDYVQLMNDLFVANRPAFYCSVGSYRNAAITEGISIYFTRSAYYPTKSAPFFAAITPQPRMAMRSIIRQASQAVTRTGFTTITPPVRDAGAGWLMLGGDGGLILND